MSQTVPSPPSRSVPGFVGVVALLAAVACTNGSRTTATPSTTTTIEAPASTTGAAPAATSPTEPPTTAGAPATVVTRGDPSRRIVALTFDAGADTGFTAQILDVLDRSAVGATFGVTGRWAAANPGLVRRIAAAGHVVMNHSYEHRSFTGTSARPALTNAAERRDDVEHAEEVIRNLTGRSTRPWFRPPYGDYDASVNAAVGALGYRYNVLWTVDSLGWQGRSPAAITARCLEATVPGAILLFHVGAASQDATALPGIIAGLRDRGYAFGTIADLLGP